MLFGTSGHGLPNAAVEEAYRRPLVGLSLGVAFTSPRADRSIEGRTSHDPVWNSESIGNKECSRSVGVGYDADDSCDRKVSVETWAHSADPPELPEWDRAVRVLIVEPVASSGIAFMTRFQPGLVAEIAFGLHIEWWTALRSDEAWPRLPLGLSKPLAPCPCTGPCRAGTLRMLLVVLQSVSWSSGTCGPVRTLCFAKAPNMEEDW
jgi:hypothetical protein